MGTGLLAACLAAMVAGHASSGSAAGAGDAGAATAVVGLTSAPPFAMRDAEGAWQGIAVDLWRSVATELGLRFELRELAIPELTTGLQTGALFAVATATASADREPIIEFSHPYYTSQLVIAVRSGPGDGGRWLDSLRSFASVGLMKTIGMLIGLLLLAGVLVWLVERRANPEQFPAAARPGIGDGLWWAAVTMTTVGYGDKAPRTGLGRALGVVWMFAAIVLIALLTAQVTSSLTVSSLSGIVRGPDDLVRVRVGAPRTLPPRHGCARSSAWPPAAIPASQTACARWISASWTPSSGSSRCCGTRSPTRLPGGSASSASRSRGPTMCSRSRTARPSAGR